MNIESLFKNNNKSGSTIGGNFIYDAARRGQQDVLHGVKDIDKYTDRGITPVVGENLDAYLPETQSAWTKLGNSLAQTAIAELALGIPKAFADLADVIGTSIFKGNEDYTNPVSQFLEQKQEEFRNFAPIYANPDVNIDNVGDASWGDKIGWFASNAPSIVSSLTLMIPGAGLIKGVSALAKLANIGARSKRLISAVSGAAKRIEQKEKLNKFQKFLISDKTAKATNMFLENTATAAISRTVENYQEGRQTYNDMYVQASEHFKDDKEFADFVKRNEEQLDKDGVDKTNKDEVAKYVANKSADETFKLDYLNTAFDVLQLYSIKNAWKTLRNAPNTNRKIKKLNEQAAKELGKTDEQIAKLHEGISKVSKVKDAVINTTLGSTKTIAAELSEGVEEAVNYIAQQEGMTFGNNLLTGEGVYSDFWDRVTNGFDGRLNSYLNSPELHESAFWGVLGGVVFQGGASGINRVKNTIESRIADKENEDVKKEKKPWYWLEQLPETKRRIEEIKQRNKIYNTYLDNLKQINDGIDVFQSPENQQKGQLDTEELKEAARNRAFDEYITNITMNAINTGNYDLLKAYLQDDNVRQGMIESGLFKGEGKTPGEIETESKTFVDNAVKKMEEVADEYDRELVSLNYITAGKQFKGRVPEEFLGIIAVDNIKAKQAIQEQDAIIASTNQNIANIKASLQDDPNSSKLDILSNNERAIELNIMAAQLGYLREQRKQIAKAPDSVSKQISLNNIDKQIDNIEKDLKDEELYYTTALSLQAYTREDGKIGFEMNEDFLDYYGSIMQENPETKQGNKLKFEVIDSELLHLNARALSRTDETMRHAYKLIDQDSNHALNILREVSPELADAYVQKGNANLKKKYYQSMINKTADNVATRVGELTNTFNVARNNAIKNKGRLMTDLYIKHGNIIRDIVKAEYNGDTKALKNLYSKLDSKTVTTIKDIFKIFDFTKSANQNIALDLENAFNKVDVAIEVRKKKAEKNGQLENTTNSQAVSEQETAQTEESSSESQTANTGQPVTPQGQPTPTSQPQSQTQPQVQTVPANPASTTNPTSTTQPDSKPKTNIKIINVTRNSVNNSRANVELENNNDGTFSIVNPELSDINNDELYDTTGVNLTRPYEIENKPIVIKQGNSYILNKKGKVVNTDTVEYQQRQQAQTAQRQSQSANPSTGGVVGQTAQQQVAQQSSVPQRTEVAPIATESLPTDNSFNATIEEQLQERHYLEAGAYNAILSAIMPIFVKNKDNTNFNVEDLIDTTIDLLVAKNDGYDRETLESQRTVVLSLLNRLQKGVSSSKLQSSTDELIIESVGNIFETTNGKTVFRLNYTKAVDNLIQQYCDEFGVPTINGKKYINFEDVLRYLNSLSDDKLTSSILYYGLNEYLKTDEAKTKYIRTDELGDNLEEAEKTIQKSEEERNIERLNNLPQRINLDSTVLAVDEDLDEEMQEAFNESELGDELTYEVVNNIRLIFRTKSGKIIGSNTLPQIDPKTGVRSLRVANIIYKINTDSHGEIISDTKDLIYKWFTSDDKNCKDIRSILYQLTYENVPDTAKSFLIGRFVSNPEVKQAIQDGLLTDISESEEAANIAISHLGKLLRYKNSKNDMSDIAIEGSLYQWFKKVYDNYESALYLKANPNTKIQISKISDGVVIRNYNKPQTEDYIPASKAIAGGVNVSVNKIARTNNGITKESGGYGVATKFAAGSTHVVIPNRSGAKEYIMCRPATVTDSFIGETGKEIVAALRTHIAELLNNYANNKTAENYNALKEFILNTFDNVNNSCLFYGASGFTVTQNKGEVLVLRNPKGLKISIDLRENTVDVFRPEYPQVNIDGGIYNKQKVPINDKSVINTINDIINGLSFNISDKLINSDNTSEDANIKGIVDKRSNKFTIKIGDNSWSFNSYNEFMLTNDLVALNTHPNEAGTSNFTRGNMSSLDYSIIKEQETTETSETTSPVESIQPVEIPSSMSKTDRAIGILNGSIPTKHKGEALFSLFNDDSKVLESLKKFGLLPENVIFDENFNKDPNDKQENNAQTDVKTGQVIVGTKWLNLFNTNRSYAMRVLIHERLHQILHNGKNEGYIKSLTDVFNEFKNSISRDSIKRFLEYYKEKQGIQKDEISVSENEIDNWIKQINSFKYEQYNNPDTQLEEFLVDSLMNGNLIEYLNSVQTDVKRKGGNRNLFQKILKILSDLFGWNIEKNSLREKELYSLRNILVTPKTTTKKVSKKDLNEQPMLPGLFDEEVQTQNNQSKAQDNVQDENKEQVQQSTAYVNEEPIKSVDEEVEVEIADTDTLSEEDMEDIMGIDSDNLDASDDFSDSPFSSTDELPIESTYTPEMQAIKEKAIADGTFMKAPNGKPTNLNERQWLQVRTKAFKEWFGDWENNPSEASKVIDENGEPLVVYHSSPEYNITVFRNTDSIIFTQYPNETIEEAINRYKELGYEISSEQIDNIRKHNYDIFENPIILTKPNGIYAASNRKVSETYITRESYEEGLYLDGEIYPVFLNIRDNNIIEGNNSNWNEIQYKGKIVSTRKLESEFRGIKDGVIIKNIFDFGSPIMDTHETNLSDIFIVYNPNQIKSATDNNGEFSTTNDDIRYSSTEELTLTTASSFLDAQSQLPIELRSNFASLVDSAVIRSQCK